VREPYYSTPRAKMRPAIKLNLDILIAFAGFLRAVVAVWCGDLHRFEYGIKKQILKTSSLSFVLVAPSQITTMSHTLSLFVYLPLPPVR
jgi:hypothetical protein